MLKTCIIIRFPRLAINYKLSTINYQLNSVFHSQECFRKILYQIAGDEALFADILDG